MSSSVEDASVAVLTRVASFASGAAVVVVVVVEAVAVGGGTGSYASTVVVVPLCGTFSVFGADALDAVITAFTAAMFTFKFDALSRHFFLLLRLPCPGPGMLVNRD